MNREMKIAIILNYIHIVVANLSSVILTPIIIDGLGMEQYGLYVLVFNTILFVYIAEFSIGNIVVSNVAKYRALNDESGERGFLGLSLIVFTALALIGTAVCLAIYTFAGDIFARTFDAQTLRQFKYLFLIMTVNNIFMFYQTYFFSVITGYQKFIFARSVMVIRFILRAILIVFIMYSGGTAAGIYISELTLTIITTVMFAAYAYKLGARIVFRNIGEKANRKIMKSAIWMYSYNMLENIYWNVGGIIFGMTHGTVQAGIYSIFVTFCIIYTQITLVIPGYFMPKISELLVTKADNSQLTDVMIQVGRLLTVILFTITIGFAAVGKDFILLWIGGDFAPAYTLTAVVFGILVFSQSLIPGDIIVQAQNKYGPRTVIALISTVCCIILSYIFIDKFGLDLAFMGILITAIAFRLLTLGIYLNKTGLELPRYIKEVFGQLIYIMAICVVVCAALQRWNVAGITAIILKAAVIMTVYYIALWTAYLNKDEKDLVLSVINRK